MKPSLIYKINFLLLGLGLTFYFIYVLNTRGLSPGMKAFFGITDQAQAELTVSWCDTRVEAMILPEKFKISQVGKAWMRENSRKTELDFIAVEKWFGKYCKVDGVKTVAEETEFSPALVIKFITGQVAVLKRHASGAFLWQGQMFKSPTLDAALVELDQVPPAKRH